MKLYEINEEILALMDQLEVDEETGEITENADVIFEQIEALQMEKRTILEYLAKIILNNRAEAAAIKQEEARLKNRRAALTKKEESIMRILDRECAGEKTDLGVATVAYRKTARVDVSDSAKAIDWLASNAHEECLRVPPPEVSKTEVKKLLNSGQEVPGCALVEDYSCSLR